MASTSETFFQRTLEQKTSEAREALQHCVAEFLSHEPLRREPSATNAHAAVGRIVEMLHPNDRPNWLTNLYSSLEDARTYSTDQHGVRAMQKIVNDYQVTLNTHRWKLVDIDTTSGFDFDGLFAKYKAENRIPELFDAIIAAMTSIVESGEIDSVKALREIERIISTLNNARNGSYFATRNAWFFVATWFKNAGWEMLGDLPVLGGAVRGLRKTLDDMDTGMENMHHQIQQELEKQLVQDFPRLEYHKPEMPRLEYSETEERSKAT